MPENFQTDVQWTRRSIPPLDYPQRQLIRQVFSDPLSIPDEWITWLKGRLELDPPDLGITNVTNVNSFGETGMFDGSSNGDNAAADLAVVDDRHGLWDMGDPDQLVIPEGLGGKWQVVVSVTESSL